MPDQYIKQNRPQVFNDPGHAHELTFSCYRRRPFLSKDKTRQYLAEAIIKARAKHRFHVWAYVFMPEHVHIVIWPTEEVYSISHIRKSIKQSVARRALIYLRKHNPNGLRWLATGQKGTPFRFWEDGPGYDRNITLTKTLGKMVEYIHDNPVRRELVRCAEDWFWSSAREWAGMGRGPVPVDKGSFPPIEK